MDPISIATQVATQVKDLFYRAFQLFNSHEAAPEKLMETVAEEFSSPTPPATKARFECWEVVEGHFWAVVKASQHAVRVHNLEIYILAK